MPDRPKRGLINKVQYRAIPPPRDKAMQVVLTLLVLVLPLRAADKSHTNFKYILFSDN